MSKIIKKIDTWIIEVDGSNVSVLSTVGPMKEYRLEISKPVLDKIFSLQEKVQKFQALLDQLLASLIQDQIKEDGAQITYLGDRKRQKIIDQLRREGFIYKKLD